MFKSVHDPEFIELLTPADREMYFTLGKLFSESIHGRQRDHRLENFMFLLDMIRKFAQRNDVNDWKRCLVCGVAFFDGNKIAINTHQLGFIYQKCKSSINGALKHLGWQTTVARGDLDPLLVEFFPILRGQRAKLRQWSIRILDNVSYSCSDNFKNSSALINENENFISSPEFLEDSSIYTPLEETKKSKSLPVPLINDSSNQNFQNQFQIESDLKNSFDGNPTTESFLENDIEQISFYDDSLYDFSLDCEI